MRKEQLRAARALLGISVKEFADMAETSTRTVSRFETGQGGLNMATHDKFIKILEDRGVQFLENGDLAQGSGVCITDQNE